MSYADKLRSMGVTVRVVTGPRHHDPRIEAGRRREGWMFGWGKKGEAMSTKNTTYIPHGYPSGSGWIPKPGVDERPEDCCEYCWKHDACSEVARNGYCAECCDAILDTDYREVCEALDTLLIAIDKYNPSVLNLAIARARRIRGQQ